MQDAFSAALGRLREAASALGRSPSAEQLEQMRSACSGALAVARGQALGAVQQKHVWETAAVCWNASIELGPGDDGGVIATGGGQRGGAAALLQAACDLGGLLPPGSLPQAHDAVVLVRFHLRAGQALAALGELEAAEAVLSRGSEAAAAHGLPTLCYERRARGPVHQECAEALYQLVLERLGVAMLLDQQMLASGLVKQAQAFVADPRLPHREGLALRLRLIGLLRTEGQRLAQARQPGAAVPLLSTAYECLSQMDIETEGEESELAAMADEAQAQGAAVLTLLAFCSVEAGQAEQAQACLQALRQLAGCQAATSFSTAFLSFRVLLVLGSTGEAETELLNLVSHEDATAEGCLAALQAALGSPGGVAPARAALSMVLERFADEPGVAVELVRAALRVASQAAAAASAAADPGAAGTASVAADASGQETASAAQALVLELVGDDRLVERVCEEGELRRELLSMLWNHATSALHGSQASDTALAFFTAVLPLLDGGCSAATQAEPGTGSQEDVPTAAACRRAQALCCMGTQQYGRALEFLDTAEQLEPGSLPTAMLRLTVQLGAGSEPGAAAAVAALADCPAADPDVLRIACVQAVEAGATGAAQRALSLLLERCKDGAGGGEGGASSATAGGMGSPGYEATIFQNLIQLLLADCAAAAEAVTAQAAASGDAAAAAEGADADGATARRASELARLFDWVLERMRAVGATTFFLDHEGRPVQHEWFVAQAWNAGKQLGAAGELQQAAVLLAVCGDLAAALPLPTIPVLQRQKMAFLMAATCACEVHVTQLAAEQAPAAQGGDLAVPEQQAAAPSSSSLTLARSYLQQARSAAAGLAAQQAALAGEGGGPQAVDAKPDVYLLLLDFRLCWLAGEVAAQLEVLGRARALPAFGAEQFNQAAAWAQTAPAGGRQPPAEVARAALSGRLQRLTEQAPLDCAAVACTLRQLVELQPGDTERLQLFSEFSGLLASLPPGSFPPQEVRWLLTTAWNRGAMHVRFGRLGAGEPLLRWGLEALPHAGPELAREHSDDMHSSLDKVRSEMEGGVTTT